MMKLYRCGFITFFKESIVIIFHLVPFSEIGYIWRPKVDMNLQTSLIFSYNLFHRFQEIFQVCKMLCTILLVDYEITFSPAQ